MHLQKHLLPAACNGPAHRGIGSTGGAHIKEIDAVVNGFADDGFDLVHRSSANAAEAQSQNTELFFFISVGKLSVFHKLYLRCFKCFRDGFHMFRDR